MHGYIDGGGQRAVLAVRHAEQGDGLADAAFPFDHNIALFSFCPAFPDDVPHRDGAFGILAFCLRLSQRFKLFRFFHAGIQLLVNAVVFQQHKAGMIVPRAAKKVF